MFSLEVHCIRFWIHCTIYFVGWMSNASTKTQFKRTRERERKRYIYGFSYWISDVNTTEFIDGFFSTMMHIFWLLLLLLWLQPNQREIFAGIPAFCVFGDVSFYLHDSFREMWIQAIKWANMYEIDWDRRQENEREWKWVECTTTGYEMKNLISEYFQLNALPVQWQRIHSVKFIQT